MNYYREDIPLDAIDYIEDLHLQIEQLREALQGFLDAFNGEIEPQDDSEIPLYTAPPTIDDETRSMVLELCSAVQEHVSVWTYPYGKQTLELAKQIREKLEGK